MSQLFHHPTVCDSYEVEVADDGTFLVKDFNDPEGVLCFESWDDLNRLSDLIIIALSMTYPIPEQIGPDSDDVPF